MAADRPAPPPPQRDPISLAEWIVEVAGQLLAVEGGHRAIGAAAAQLLEQGLAPELVERSGCSPSVPTSTVVATA